METLDFNEVLQDFQYKPNFRCAAVELEGLWHIRIVMYVEDSRRRASPWELRPLPDEETYFYNDDMFCFRPPSNSVGYSPSREMTEVVGAFKIPPFKEGEDELFVHWMVDTIRMLEEHETYEWLRYKGELIKDPHKETTP